MHRHCGRPRSNRTDVRLGGLHEADPNATGMELPAAPVDHRVAEELPSDRFALLGRRGEGGGLGAGVAATIAGGLAGAGPVAALAAPVGGGVGAAPLAAGVSLAGGWALAAGWAGAAALAEGLVVAVAVAVPEGLGLAVAEGLGLAVAVPEGNRSQLPTLSWSGFTPGLAFCRAATEVP